MIGHNIYRIRKERGLTLSDLSERTGISKSYLSNIERNLKQNPSIQVMEKIAFVLKVDLKTLLKVTTDNEIKLPFDKEWFDFMAALIETGIDKQQIHQYKILVEFLKWYNETKLIKK
ncbi:transcriptional regulator [Cohnella kolymensis]|uniref:Transcriptional regulator n=1 Tax=Cohnella kolymensis TaxID=1590652 RepID=A0ABR5A2X4_9BACL|nr:helix-turn-helix domain-containing protein [Cohnella kolymensis]KIL35417.1 transcriptional regulator [Cohnella kolymensis]